ncbi:MAG: Gfo/Idh/MocA family oxidoreductase [Saprospiraceae bacterium]
MKNDALPAPVVDYLPRKPRSYHPPIGVIGAGGIAGIHLRNYQQMGLNVVAIADINREAAEKRRDEFFPTATVHTDYREILDRPEIEVVDVNLHPQARLQILEDALTAGKHVLSQKPYVLDLADGHRLVELARKHHVKLAVNQNGRWAPHFSYLRNAIEAGLIGDVVSVDFTALFDQTWIKGNPAFENIRHMVLYDYAIHWFDILHCFMRGERAESVYASVGGFVGQTFRPPSLASVVINYAHAHARLGFNAHACFGSQDSTIVVGTKGTIRTGGADLNAQREVQIQTEDGKVTVPLEGEWFVQGFQGTMGELLCAIEEDREPSNSAANNLGSMELCFAALASADTGLPAHPGTVTTVGTC